MIPINIKNMAYKEFVQEGYISKKRHPNAWDAFVKKYRWTNYSGIETLVWASSMVIDMVMLPASSTFAMRSSCG